jgi:hypothetical protein
MENFPPHIIRYSSYHCLDPMIVTELINCGDVPISHKCTETRFPTGRRPRNPLSITLIYVGSCTRRLLSFTAVCLATQQVYCQCWSSRH